MPQFKISMDWEVYATAYIEADNLKQAIELVNSDDFPLPTDTHFVDGSFKVDMQSTMALNDFHTVHDIIDRGYNLEPIHCVHCGSTEVTFNQQIGDGSCGECGKWQISED